MPQVFYDLQGEIDQIRNFTRYHQGSSNYTDQKFLIYSQTANRIQSSTYDQTSFQLNLGIPELRRGADQSKPTSGVQTGQVYFQNDTRRIYLFDGTSWLLFGNSQGGTSTANYVQKFTDSTGTLQNSQIFDDGTNIGIGTTTPQVKFHVVGTIRQDVLQIGGATYNISTTSFNLPSGTVQGNLTVTGDLTVSGTTVTVSATNIVAQDPIIILGGVTPPTSDDQKDKGVQFRWHTGTAQKIGFFGFRRSTQEFIYIPDQTITNEVVTGTVGTINQNLNGNQTTQSRWQTARTLTLTGQVTGSVSFDGSADITLNTAVNHTHGTFNRTSSPLTGQQVFNDIVVSNGIVTNITTRNLTPQDIGQQQQTHTHAGTDITTGTVPEARLPLQTQGSASAGQVRYQGTTKTAGQFYGGTTAPDQSTRLNYDGEFYQTKVYGSVFNDYQEFREQQEEVDSGYVQMVDEKTGKLVRCHKERQSSQYIVSDTYGMAVGKTNDQEIQLPIQVQGRVLQYVKGKEKLKVGDQLVTTKDGMLRKIKWWEKIFFPEQIIGVVDEIPSYEMWKNNVKVNGRVWVKVK